MNSSTLKPASRHRTHIFSAKDKLLYFTLQIFGLLLAGSFQTLTAQTANKMRGVVINEQGNPLTNVSVVVKETIVRLRSVSERKEYCKLTYPAGEPGSVFICSPGEKPLRQSTGNIELPQYGTVSLRVVF